MLRFLLLVSALAVALAACGDTPDPHDALRACGLLTEGEVRWDAFYAPTSCYRECLAEGSCEELEAALCRSSIELLQRCDARCAYRCDDDSLLPVEAECNGVVECVGGEDEAGCPTMICDDGSEVGGARCDGRWNCPDGSDERACPVDCDQSWNSTCPPYRCPDGTEINYQPRCDGWAQCPDGSDEDGCAELILMCSP